MTWLTYVTYLLGIFGLDESIVFAEKSGGKENCTGKWEFHGDWLIDWLIDWLVGCFIWFDQLSLWWSGRLQKFMSNRSWITQASLLSFQYKASPSKSMEYIDRDCTIISKPWPQFFRNFTKYEWHDVHMWFHEWMNHVLRSKKMIIHFIILRRLI